MWLYVPGVDSTSPRFVPESGDWISPSSSSSQEPQPFCSVSGKLTPRPFSWRGWRTRYWTRRLSAIPCQTSALSGVEAWISLLLDSPASPTLGPESNRDMKTREPSGRSSLISSNGCGLPWCSSRTCPSSCDSFNLSEKLYLAWATKLRSQYSSRRKKLGPLTSGSGSSSSPTTWPTANSRDGDKWNNRIGVKGRQTNLSGSVTQWPTPTVRDAKNPDREDSGNYQRKVEKGWTIDLGIVAHNWTPPRVEIWQTPGTDSFRSRGGDRKDEMGLDQEARNWESSLPAEMTGMPGGVCWCGNPSCVLPSHKRKLNPWFVEWLMGLPIGWTLPTKLDRNVFDVWVMQSRLCLGLLLSRYS